MLTALFLVLFDVGCSIQYSQTAEPGQERDTPVFQKLDVHYAITPQDVVERMLELAHVTREDVVYDLGCGDGRIVITAAMKYGCRAVGYDIDPDRVFEARELVRKNGVEKLVHIEERDIFTLDLSEATVITLYLLPTLNVKLIPQFEKCRTGTRIVSHDFDMQGLVIPVKTVTVHSHDLDHPLYLWITPLKKM